MFRVPLQHNSGRATALAGVPCRQSSKHFISGQLKVIPLFRYSVIPYSAFYSIPAVIEFVLSYSYLLVSFTSYILHFLCY